MSTALVVVVAVIGLVYIGKQVVAGTVVFGTGGTGCGVTGPATTFPRSAYIHYAAFFHYVVPAGTIITEVVTLPDGTKDPRDLAIGKSTDCMSSSFAAGGPPGHYVVEERHGSTDLSKGAFDITP